MKNFAKLMQLVAALFLVGSLLVGGASFLVTILAAGDVAGGVPMSYYEKLNLEWLSIILPALGIVAFLLTLPTVLPERKNSEESSVLAFPSRTSAEDSNKQHLRAA